MILAWILFVLGFLAVVATPAYYLAVAKPWRNPIGRLMLVQMGTFVIVYLRTLAALIDGRSHLPMDARSIYFTILIDAFLWAFIPVYEYTRRKARK